MAKTGAGGGGARREALGAAWSMVKTFVVYEAYHCNSDTLGSIAHCRLWLLQAAAVLCGTGISVGLSCPPPSSPPTCPFRNHNDKEKPYPFPDLSVADNFPGFPLPAPARQDRSRLKDALPGLTIAVGSVDVLSLTESV